MLFVLDWILTALTAILSWRIYHAYVECGGGRPACGMRRILALFVSGINVHTADVFGVTVKPVGKVLDSGYEVGGGWDVKFPTLSP